MPQLQYDERLQLINETQNFIAHMKARGIPAWLIADALLFQAAFESARLGWNVYDMQARFAQYMTAYQH